MAPASSTPASSKKAKGFTLEKDGPPAQWSMFKRYREEHDNKMPPCATQTRDESKHEIFTITSRLGETVDMKRYLVGDRKQVLVVQGPTHEPVIVRQQAVKGLARSQRAFFIWQPDNVNSEFEESHSFIGTPVLEATPSDKKAGDHTHTEKIKSMTAAGISH